MTKKLNKKYKHNLHGPEQAWFIHENNVHIASWRDEEGNQGGGPWYKEIPLRLGQLIIWNKTSVPPLDMHEWTSYYFWEFYCYEPEAHC
jgi:hypothetical protein